jgi:hypothetical protein
MYASELRLIRSHAPIAALLFIASLNFVPQAQAEEARPATTAAASPMGAFGAGLGIGVGGLIVLGLPGAIMFGVGLSRRNQPAAARSAQLRLLPHAAVNGAGISAAETF